MSNQQINVSKGFVLLTLFSLVSKVFSVDMLCMAANTSGSCTACYKSYPNSSGVCVAVASPDANAITYTSATAVGTCANGYYANASACTAIPTSCTNCAQGTMSGSTFTPSSCSTGYTLVNGACVASTTSNCTVSSCSSCTTSTVCSLCSGTNVLTVATSGTTTCATGPANCGVASSSTVCTTCAAGYYISSGACTKGIVTFFGQILSLLLVFIF